jgi:glycosyltransferase involved in cell wall biosynthesis
MRLLHVVPSFHPAHGYGGPIASLYGLCRAQVAQGLSVRVLTSDADGPGRHLTGLGGGWVHRYGVPTWYARATARQDFSLELLLRLPGLLSWADLVHITAVFSPTSMAALGLSCAGRRRVVVSPRGSLLPWALAQGGVRKRAVLSGLRPLMRRVAGWHVTSAAEQDSLAATGCAGPGSAVAVIENGIDLAPLQRQAGARGPVLDRLLPAGAGPVITMLGRIDPVKGIDLALCALAELRREHPGAVLVLAGPDPTGHGTHLRQEAARLGVPLCFAGLVVEPEKSRLLAGSDLLWLCSKMESFGNVVPEALAQGTPVVAVHGTPWRWLEETGLGRHVPATPSAVAAAARGLLSAAGAGFTARSRAAVAARFSWPEISRRMTVLYETVLSSAGS